MNDDAGIDIGGVRVAWVEKDGVPLGIIETHEHVDEIGQPYSYSGSVPIDPTYHADAPHWRIVAGTAGSFDGLTLEPSIACRSCPNHGWIRDGRWVPA